MSEAPTQVEPLPCLRDRCDKLCSGWSLVRNEDTKPMRDRLRAKLMVVCRELGLSDGDRHELSIAVTGAKTSWGKMTYMELEKLADFISGFGFVATILRDRVATVGLNLRARQALDPERTTEETS